MGTVRHGVHGSVAEVRYRTWYATNVVLVVWLTVTATVPRAPVGDDNVGVAVAVSADLCGGLQCTCIWQSGKPLA